MNQPSAATRLSEKTTRRALQVELQTGYSLSPVEAQVLAQYVQELIDEYTDLARQPGQIIYQAIALEEPAGKPLAACRKVPVQLTVYSAEDAQCWATQEPEMLRRLRVHRLVYEALLQGGALSQEDLGCVLGVSVKTIKRIFAYYRKTGHPLASRGEVCDMGRGVSHKIPVIRKYVQDLSFSTISQHLNHHGLRSMQRYLRHFALVLLLEERGLAAAEMQSIIGISETLIAQYHALYQELNHPQYQRTLERLKLTVGHLPPPRGAETPPSTLPSPPAPPASEKGGPP